MENTVRQLETEEANVNLENAWQILLNNQEMIRFADQKVSVVLVISGIMTSFVFGGVDKIRLLGLEGHVSLGLFLMSFGAFLYYAFKALFARSATRTGRNVPKLIYFQHIAERREASEYCEELSATTNVDMFRDLAYQIYEVSIIATKKYSNFKKTYWALTFQFIIFIYLMWRVAV